MTATIHTLEPSQASARNTRIWSALPRVPNYRLLLTTAAMLVIQVSGHGQTRATAASPEAAMQHHYNEAYRLQDAGKLDLADAEHKFFLADALHRIANGRANLGEYSRASALYEEALQCGQNDDTLQLDYAAAALDAGDWATAKKWAQHAQEQLAGQSAKLQANAASLLAQALWAAGEHQESLAQFKAAADLKPGFDSSYALSRTYLALSDKAHAVDVFSQLISSQGDTATLHMEFGRAYALANFFPEAVEEFKKAIAKDDRLPGIHYSLGAAYIQRDGEQGYPQAESEFHRELALHPNDTFTYPQLGTIAVSQHKLSEAEADFKRALQLNSSVPGTYYSLGQLYSSMGRKVEAEAALRSAIAVMIDPTRNNYEGQRIHYALGRLLLEEGKSVEAKEELKIAEGLLVESRREDASLMGGQIAMKTPLTKTHEAKASDVTSETEYERKAAPLIAGSYNNLGVHAAIRGDYVSAAAFFNRTAQWYPSLHGLDRNLGRAAFLAAQYAHATSPLQRLLAAQPEDVETRTMLGLSYAKTGEYRKAVTVLKPIESSIDATPPLALAYAESIFRAGDPKEGLARLEHLAEISSDAAMPHQVLGEAYASIERFEESALELRKAVQLNPENTEARSSLATTLAALGQNREAILLLSQLTQSGSKDASVYLQLGKLQLQTGDIHAALSNLQTSSSLDPANIACHQVLVVAYRRNAQPEDALREQQLAETLKGSRSSAANAGSGTPAPSTSPTHAN